MNMRTDHTIVSRSGICFLVLLLFLLTAPLPLSAQKRSRQVHIPASALECPYTAEDIFNKLNPLNEWVNVWKTANKKNNFNEQLAVWLGNQDDLKKQKTFRLSMLEPTIIVLRETGKDDKKSSKKRNRKKNQAVAESAAELSTAQKMASGTAYRLTKNDFRKNYRSFEAFLRLKRLTDDMQEATKMDISSFRTFDKEVKKLEAILEKMDLLRTSDGKMEDFRKIYEKEFIPALNAVSTALSTLKESPKMPAEKRRILRENNEKRRRAAYLEMLNGGNDKQDKKTQEKR